MAVVYVSNHAIARMRERFDGRANPAATIEREVREGIEAGRRSKRRPAWTATWTMDGRPDGSTRYVWTERQSRCYVVASKRGPKGAGVIVVTVLGQGDPELLRRHELVIAETKPKSWPRKKKSLDNSRKRQLHRLEEE